MGTFSIDESTTLDEFKKDFHRQHKSLDPSRQYFTLNTAKGRPLKDGDCVLMQEMAKSDSLMFKDLGPQMSWRLVYMIEYLGPCLLFPLFFYCDELVYGVKFDKRKE
jgi:very-long-chain enoyl-CoA reductase